MPAMLVEQPLVLVDGDKAQHVASARRLHGEVDHAATRGEYREGVDQGLVEVQLHGLLRAEGVALQIEPGEVLIPVVLVVDVPQRDARRLGVEDPVHPIELPRRAAVSYTHLTLPTS